MEWYIVSDGVVVQSVLEEKFLAKSSAKSAAKFLAKFSAKSAAKSSAKSVVNSSVKWMSIEEIIERLLR